jgi:hypothetical protein
MSPIPKVRDDDPEDVSWALSTAATQFARGDRAEALKWLRRAAEAASEAEHDSRALELAKAAADLTTAPVSPTPKAPAVSPSKVSAKPKATPTPPPPAKKKSKADETGRRSAVKPARRLVTDEQTDVQAARPVAQAQPPEPTVPAAEADLWPTEAMGQTELDALADVYGQERTRIGALPYRPEDDKRADFRASQAVHVVVWRAPDGTLRIAPKGTSVSAVTIEALLVAPGPDVDLLAWLGV